MTEVSPKSEVLLAPVVDDDIKSLSSLQVDEFLCDGGPVTPRCLAANGKDTQVTTQFRKAVQEIQQFVMRFGPTSYSGQTTPALPQATEIARSFIIIDKILFKKLRSPDCDDFIEVIPLLEVIGRTLTLIPRIAVDSQGCDELIAVILQTIGLMGAFIPTSFRDLVPLQVAGGLASLPLTSHRLCLDILCLNVLPLCLTQGRSRGGMLDPGDQPLACASGVMAHVLQHSPSNTVHARVLETIMSLKEGVCNDLLQLIAVSSTSLRQHAVRLLFHYFPQLQLSGSYYTKLKPSSWSHPLCQFRSCQASGGERLTATKMCMNAICASSTGGHYPPLYLCEGCCNKVHPNNNKDSHLIISLCQPFVSLPRCEDDGCVGGQTLTVTCFDSRCTNGGRPKQMCDMCHQRYHSHLTGRGEMHYPIQKSLPYLSESVYSQQNSTLVEAVVNLLCDVAQDPANLRSGNTRKTRARMKRPTTATNSVFTAELDPTKDSRLLSHFGLVLLTSYCSVEAKLDPRLLGRLVAGVITWVDGFAKIEHGIIKDNLEPLAVKYLKPWLEKFCSCHLGILMECLEPDPPPYGRVGEQWMIITSPFEQHKLGLQRLLNFLSKGLVAERTVFQIWNAVMPKWLKLLSQQVSRKDIAELESIMQKLFTMKLFRNSDMFDKFKFLKSGLSAHRMWDQILHLQLYQVLLQTHLSVPKIESCFIDILMSDFQPPLPTNRVTASFGQITSNSQTCANSTPRCSISLVSPSPAQQPQNSRRQLSCSSSLGTAPFLEVQPPANPPLLRTQSAKPSAVAARKFTSPPKLVARHSLPWKSKHTATANTSPTSIRGSSRFRRRKGKKDGLKRSVSVTSFSHFSIKGALSTALNVSQAHTLSSASMRDNTPPQSQQNAEPNFGTSVSETDIDVTDHSPESFPSVVPNSCVLLLRSILMLDTIVLLLAADDWKDTAEASRVDDSTVKQLLVIMLQLDWGDHDATDVSNRDGLMWKETDAELLFAAAAEGLKCGGLPAEKSGHSFEEDSEVKPEEGLKAKPSGSANSSFNAALLVSRFVHIAKRTRDSQFNTDDHTSKSSPNERERARSLFNQHRISGVMDSPPPSRSRHSKDSGSVRNRTYSLSRANDGHGGVHKERSVSRRRKMRRMSSDSTLASTDDQEGRNSKRLHSSDLETVSNKKRGSMDSGKRGSTTDAKRGSISDGKRSSVARMVKLNDSHVKVSCKSSGSTGADEPAATSGVKLLKSSISPRRGSTGPADDAPSSGLRAQKAWDVLRSLRGNPKLALGASGNHSGSNHSIKASGASDHTNIPAKTSLGDKTSSSGGSAEMSSSGVRFVNLVKQAQLAFRESRLSTGADTAKDKVSVPELTVRHVPLSHTGSHTMTETSFVGTNSSIGMLSESDAETDYDNRKSPDYLSSQDSEYIKHVTPEDSYQSQPVLIQLFFGVLQKLVEIKGGTNGPHLEVLSCLLVLLQNANCLQLLRILSESLQVDLISKTLVPRLWELMVKTDTGHADAAYVVLTECMDSYAGPLALALEIREALGNSRWQSRFKAIEQVLTLHYTIQSAAFQDNFPGQSAVLALTFTLLMERLQDSSHQVSVQCMMMLESMPVASLKMMVSAAEKQFCTVPTDRPCLLKALHELLRILPTTSALGESFFCRMLQAIQTEIDPEEEVALPILRLFSRASFGGESDDIDGNESMFGHHSRESSSSCASSSRQNVNVGESMSSETVSAEMMAKYKQSAPYMNLALNKPVVLLKHSSDAFRDFVEVVFTKDRISVDTFDQKFGDRSSLNLLPSISSRSVANQPYVVIDSNQQTPPEPTIVMHSVMRLFMKYMLTHAPSSSAGTGRKYGKANTVGILISMIKALMGCKVRSSIAVFSRPPKDIRTQPAFNVFIMNIAKVLDVNVEWGALLSSFTLSVLRFCTAPNLEEGLSLSGPHYGLENLDAERQQAWLRTALVILYKYPYQANDVHDVIRIILLTLQDRPHEKCLAHRRHSTVSLIPESSSTPRMKGKPQSCPDHMLVSSCAGDQLSAIGELDSEIFSRGTRDSLSSSSFPHTVLPVRAKASRTEPHPAMSGSISSNDPESANPIDSTCSLPNSRCLTQLCMDAKDPKVKPAKSLTQLSVSHSPGANSGLAAPAFISELYRGGDAPLSTSMLGIHSATPRHSSSQGQTSAAETLRLRLRALNGSVNQTSDTPRDISIASAAHRDIDLSVFCELPPLTGLIPPNAGTNRCPRCGQPTPTFSDNVLALAVICLEPMIQRFPAMAAPLLMEMLHTVSRVAMLSTDSSSGAVGNYAAAPAVAQQFIRTVLGQFENNQLFLQIFKSSLKTSSLLKAMVASLPEPGQVPSTYTGLTLLTPVASLLGDISRHSSGLPMMMIISNLDDYLQALPVISPKHYNSLLPLFDRFFRKLPSVFDTIGMFKRKHIVPLRIMALLLRNVDRHFQVLLPSFSIVMSYLLRQSHQMIPLGAILTVCFRALLNFTNVKDKERLPRCIVGALILAWRGKILPHRSTFLNMIKFVAIDCGANISNIVGFDGKEIPSSSLPRNLRVRQHILSSIDVAVNFLQSTYASTTLYQDLETSAKIKVATAQVVGMEITGYQNKSQLERLLPWLNSSTSGTVGQLTEVQLVQRFRLLCWLLVAAMASDSNEDHSLCQPFIDSWVSVSSCIVQHCSVFLHSLQEKTNTGKDRRVQILPMMFTTCLLWTVYLEQQCIAEQAGNDFWGQLMAEILALLNFKSRLFESVVTVPFLDMIEGFAKSESSSLHRIWPIWLPLLRCSSSQFIKPTHDFVIKKLRCPAPDSRISVPQRRTILSWLQGVQLKLVEHEQSWEKNLFTQLRSRTTRG